MAKVKQETSEPKAENEQLETQESLEQPAEKPLGNSKEVELVAVDITLRDTHPQAAYGRCGYRFNKVTPVRLMVADLPDDGLAVLTQDPYLVIEYVTD